MVRQILRGCSHFVAILAFCRNNLERKTRKKLEPVHNRPTFAVSISRNGLNKLQMTMTQKR